MEKTAVHTSTVADGLWHVTMTKPAVPASESVTRMSL